MEPPSEFTRKLSRAWPPQRWCDVTVLVAVSGGADSVALLRGLAEIRGGGGSGRIVVGHFNHRLRGAESDADQRFVEQLAAARGLEAIVGSAAADLAAGGSGEGIEGAARQARYAFLESAASRCGARYVATAHTADDHVETVLLNIIRGTGLAGLAGIPRLRPLTEAATIIRPLLTVTRAEVLAYLAAIGQPFREDTTNRLTDYARNRLRQELLPILERDYNPLVRQALLRLARLAGEADREIDRLAEEVLSRAVRSTRDGIELDTRELAGHSDFLMRTVLMAAWRKQGWPLQDMSYVRWERLAQLSRAPQSSRPPPITLPGGIRAERRGEMLRLIRSAE